MRTMNFSMLTVCFLLIPVRSSTHLIVALVTGQIANELGSVGAILEKLYGILNEESLKLR
jgi:hypothetical protein